MGSPLFLGLDLGGTNLKGVIVGPEGRPLAHSVVSTRSQAGVEAVLAQIGDLADRLVKQASANWSQVVALGVGVAAWINHESGLILRAANLAGWVDVPLRQRLSGALGKPAVVENDGNAAAWGEYTAGAGWGAHSMVLLTLGTGIGGGVVVAGSLLRGYTGTAGELGHLVILPDGPECVCGNRGCLEELASARATVRRFAEAVRAGAKSSLAAKVQEGAPLSARDICKHALAGDALSREILEETGRFLALGVHDIIVAFNPQRVVLGGGMAAAGDLIMEPLAQEVARRTLPYAARHTEIRWGELGELAGAIGAAGCAAAEYPA